MSLKRKMLLKHFADLFTLYGFAVLRILKQKVHLCKSHLPSFKTNTLMSLQPPHRGYNLISTAGGGRAAPGSARVTRVQGRASLTSGP